MTGLMQDVGYALRQLGKNRGFTLVAIVTLALGIGANTAIFSVVNGVLLNPLPFPRADRTVSMFQDKPNFSNGSISYPNFLDWQRENRCFEAMASYRYADGIITGAGQAEDVPAQRVSATFFPILGVNPILGRNFTVEDDRRGASPTVMISEGIWKRKFASNPNVIGTQLTVAGESRTIVGIVPSSFRLRINNFRTADIYEPVGQDSNPAFYLRESFWGMDALGLLKPGVTLQQAREDMQRVNVGLAAGYPDINANIKSNIISLKDEISGEMRPVLLVLLGAVGFVLLIACVNVANLLLARSTARQREFSVRAALGAGHARIIRQLLTESLVLSLVGGFLGLMLAKWGTAAAVAAVPQSLPRAEEIGIDFRVLLFTLSISVITGIVFGLVPALRSSRTNIGETLKDTGRTISGHRSRVQALFVIGEMAMALVLLVGAGLMLRTLMRLWAVDPGFNPQHVIQFSLTPPPSLAHRSPDEVRAVLRQIEASIHDVPGVENASFQGGANPMEGDDEAGVWPEGQELPARQADFASSLQYSVEPEYLKAMRIPLLRGRLLTDADNEHSERVVLIDSSFAKQYFPGQDPIGKHVKVLEFDADPVQHTWVSMVVVGVVGHVNQWGLAEDAARPLQAQIYLPFMQGTSISMKDFARGADVFVRFGYSLQPEAVFQTIQKKLLDTHSDVVVSGNESEEEVVARSIASRRFSLLLLGAFAGLALLLASIGIYGVLSYLVGQRTQEIGVRMALGAQRLDVLRMVLRDGARMTLAGATIGLLAALGLTRLMASMLFGVKPTDPITFGVVAVGLCGIALFACYLPARRAMRVDPMVALRYE